MTFDLQFGPTLGAAHGDWNNFEMFVGQDGDYLVVPGMTFSATDLYILEQYNVGSAGDYLAMLEHLGSIAEEPQLAAYYAHLHGRFAAFIAELSS